MILLPAFALIALSTGRPCADTQGVPRLDVLEGSVRVLAGETWLTLARGALLPQFQAHAALSLDSRSRIRLTIAGANLELLGPLEVDSTLSGDWTVHLHGGGAARISARATSV